MSALQPLLRDARVVDLFAGSGALGLEALSRGAAEVVFVERYASIMRVLQGNVDKLGATSRVRLVRTDAMAYVSKLQHGSFDLALADPPYGRGYAEALVRRFLEVPYADWLWIEHRLDDPVPCTPEARQRRYGDTVLTAIPAANHN